MSGPAAAGSLAETFRRLIAATGPISLMHYMGESNAHYYASKDPLGAGGDFVTAPEVSQMFGELVGVWLADIWNRAGRPANVRYVELGPGRGTLARDALRAMARFGMEPKVHLVEGSPALRKIQLAAVADAQFHDDLSGVPADGPILLVANEFLDALPVRQFQRGDDGAWHERCVGLSDDGKALQFMLDPRAMPLDDILPPALRGAPPGAIVESSPAMRAVASEISARLLTQGGVALFVDYGYDRPGLGETLQAVRHHAYADPLAEPGLADLTAHVDFAAFAASARKAGAAAYGPVGQGAFLEALGIRARAERLRANANASQRIDIDAALHRLTAPEAMGTLFKAIALTPPHAPEPAGFA